MSSSAVSDMRLRFYLSTDRDISTSDYQLGGPDFYWYWTTFGALNYRQDNYSVTIPASVPSGQYYVGAILTVNGFGEDQHYPYNNITFVKNPVSVTATNPTPTFTPTPSPTPTNTRVSAPSFSFTDPIPGESRYNNPAWATSRHAEAIAFHPTLPGFYIMDSYGTVYPVGSVPWPLPGVGEEINFGWNVARDFVIAPDTNGVYILDGYGAIHLRGTGRLPYAGSGWTGASFPYFYGYDVARGLNVQFDSSSDPVGFYMLDGWGTLWRTPLSLAGPSYGDPGPNADQLWPWFGWDVTRAVGISPTPGGFYMLEGYGGIWRTGPTFRPQWGSGAGKLPYPGFDILTDIEISSTGNGICVLDAHGGIFTCGDFVLPVDIQKTGTPYFPLDYSRPKYGPQPDLGFGE
jgi:hypothetical protein